MREHCEGSLGEAVAAELRRRRRRLPWGERYIGRGDLGVAASAVESACEASKLECRITELGAGEVRIEARTEAAWYQLLLRSLPQRVTWCIAADRGGLVMEADYRFERWFKIFLAALIGTQLATFVTWLWLLDRGWPRLWTGFAEGETNVGAVSAGLMVVIALVIASFAAVPILMGPLGGGRMVVALRHRIFAPVEEAGGFLDPDGRGVTRRYGITVLTATGLAVALTLAVFVPSILDGAVSARGLVLLSATLVLVLFLISAAVMIYTVAGTGLRTEPILAGIASSAAMVIYLGLPVPALVSGAEAAELSRTPANGARTLEVMAAAGASEERLAELRAHLEEARQGRRFWALLVVFATGLVAAIGFGLSLYGVHATAYTWPLIARISMRAPKGGIYGDAVAGGGILRAVRRAFVAFWALAGVIIVAGLVAITLSALQGWVPALAVPPFRLVELSSSITALALGRSPADPVLGRVITGGWLLYAAAGLAVVGVSLGHRALAQRNLRRQLDRGAGAALREVPRDLTASFDRLTETAGVAPTKLVFSEQPGIVATAHSVGLVASRRYVEISRGTLDYLEPSQVRAFLAHEVAHLSSGHCQLESCLFWLGRLTLVGDGFVRTLIDSMGRELEADRIAINRLGASRVDLEHGLFRVRNVNPFFGGRAGRPGSWQGTARRAAARATKGLDAPFFVRQRQTMRLFVRQYSHSMPYQHWHPTLDARIAALGVGGAKGGEGE